MTEYKLIISEKPSVGKSIAAVLGASERRDGFLMGNGYIVSWCFGHLAELAEADAYDEKYAKWRYDDLPIFPEPWQYSVSRDKGKQLHLLNTLMHREDVVEVINACDAGREGELIFRTVYNLNKCDKPMKRLWISSMEDEAIRQGFANLRDGHEYDNLYAAALCRSKADWLVGINATRLFSVLYHRTLNVGRVLSPTLALLVQREAEIDAFKPKPFYTITLGLSDFAAAGEKLKTRAEAEKLQEACAGGTAMVKSVERKDKSEKPPALYDLTTLQRDANRILGYTAQQTLDYLQSLYEKKIVTYPRTDSRYLTSDMSGKLDYLDKNGYSVEHEWYEAVYAGALEYAGDTHDKLNGLYTTFNINHPADFTGHSLSVSDIVALKQNGVVSCHYVDSWGFKELPGFLPAENYLKAAELSTEDDYGMIDGIINNGKQPTVAELEQQAKSGQPISLLALAEAVHREEQEKRSAPMEPAKGKPSVLSRLRAPAATKPTNTAPKKSAEREL